MPYAAKTHRQGNRKDARKQTDREYDYRRKQDRELAMAVTIRNSVQWRNFREWYRAKHPICELCGVENRVTPMEDVHHIIPIQIRPELAFCVTNAAALCRACHARVERLSSVATRELLRRIPECISS